MATVPGGLEVERDRVEQLRVALGIADEQVAQGYADLLAKTAAPHPRLEGTIHTAAEAIVAAGGQALPIVGDVRDDDTVRAAVERTVARFGAIDIVVNNASAIASARARRSR